MFTLPEKMFIYPVQRESVQGRNNYMFVKADGSKVPANRTFSRGAHKYYSFPSSADNMSIVTGMNEQMDNPFKMEAHQVHIGSSWHDRAKELIERDSISVQQYLEVMDNQEPGTYTSTKRITQPFKQRAADKWEATFLERFRFSFEDNTNVLVSTNPEHRIAMMMARVSPRIANSRDEINPSMHDFYIGQEYEAIRAKRGKRQVIGKAIGMLEELAEKHDAFWMYQLGVIIGEVRVDTPPAIVRDRLEDYLWSQRKDQVQRCEKFIRLVGEFFKDQAGKEATYTRYLMAQAVSTRVWALRTGEYYWTSKKGTNFYRLGRKVEPILRMIHDEFSKFTADPDTDNVYADLISELKLKGARVVENKSFRQETRAKNRKTGPAKEE